jgi:two-component system, OmpR family, sensor histidine kinase KdpD
MTGMIHAIPGANRIANISMLYLLVVIGTALRFGSGPAVLASILSFLAFNFFFVQPFHTLRVQDPAEWLPLLMFLLTASTTGHLTATARKQAQEARQRERETTALAEASWAVASQLDQDRALAEVLRRVVQVVPASETAILAGEDPANPTMVARWASRKDAAGPLNTPDSLRIARSVLSDGRAVAWGNGRQHPERESMQCEEAGAGYLPLTTEQGVLGVLYLSLPEGYTVPPAEQRVVESLANLAAVVLQRDRLSRAQAKARALAEADRLKTALLSMVSHDFRSPLASIKASATACLQGEGHADSVAQQDLHLGIIYEADRLNGMVGNILALSRLEADAWRPQREEAALEEVIEAARSGVSRENNRRVAVCFDPDLDEVWLDPVQIGQVLHNLLDNALKYSAEETNVELRVLSQADDLVFEVLDRGPGLPAGEEERVFERFYRAPALRESAVPGVGIGLSVCRGLVEAHGGSLTASSRDGGGAVFRITLPGRTGE